MIKVYRGDSLVTLTLARAPREQAKKIEEINLVLFPRYLPSYCTAHFLIGFMAPFFCYCIVSSADRIGYPASHPSKPSSHNPKPSILRAAGP